ncbi:beta-phosphoglucomutase [Bifidobacterium pseudolongum subsp. pseudolongum]|uniref:Beta-phosphoglucomutase n=1 Tax=Bifidobacterium pseudolongum subsp. pseudolongum TaxID=31954 RepID=A0A4Q5A9B7_9BIFI|nr:HAD family phosphatase [Bifidobacterium pseudolongum]RYQ20325.1 beta-phosphoglucomutase [Bifidobacterium pseudolongum subsp. pseudolongum]
MTTDENLGKAAIFDLDGTLLDSMGVWDQIDAAFLAKRGIAVPDDYMETVTAMQFRDIARYTIDRFGLDDTEDELMDEWDRMAHDAYTSVVRPKAHALDYLRYLKDTGARLAVATTMPAGLRAPALRHVGMLGMFDAIVGVDDVGRGKEHPDIYLEAAARVGVPAHAATVFEDLLAGVRSAVRAGMRVWGVYDASSAQVWPSIEQAAHGTITDFAQAPRTLDG